MNTRVKLLTAALLAGLGGSAWLLSRAPQRLDTASPVTASTTLDAHTSPDPASAADVVRAYMGSTDLEAPGVEALDLGSGEIFPAGNDEPGSHAVAAEVPDEQALADEQTLAEQEAVSTPPERTPVDHQALGYESEQELLDAVRASLDIPAEHSLAVYTEMVNGEPIITIAVGIPDTSDEDGSAK